ncbi:hypothetical protein EVAR_74165_1 [Eumeta japonica]|uniref:Uncharacterized protein n=1 Tax=Eumeta variegata TaxID=151549 RepID=A0A4C1TLR6_EUMVA|nr:hypothetical protein EVAR_74165_1 [Eumeta japonica]
MMCEDIPASCAAKALSRKLESCESDSADKLDNISDEDYHESSEADDISSDEDENKWVIYDVVRYFSLKMVLKPVHLAMYKMQGNLFAVESFIHHLSDSWQRVCKDEKYLREKINYSSDEGDVINEPLECEEPPVKLEQSNVQMSQIIMKLRTVKQPKFVKQIKPIGHNEDNHDSVEGIENIETLSEVKTKVKPKYQILI